MRGRGNAAFGFAVRGAEIARTCRAEGNASADIQVLEPLSSEMVSSSNQ